jgi:hypothetical protein
MYMHAMDACHGCIVCFFFLLQGLLDTFVAIGDWHLAMQARIKWQTFMLTQACWTEVQWNTGPWAKTQHVAFTRTVVRIAWFFFVLCFFFHGFFFFQSVQTTLRTKFGHDVCRPLVHALNEAWTQALEETMHTFHALQCSLQVRLIFF